MEWKEIKSKIDEGKALRQFRIQRRIDQIPKRSRFGHWPTMYWSARRLAKDNPWWETQIDLAKKLWRRDLVEDSNRHRM